MKVRTGFVSNSSSSSFVVKFDVLPRSVEELEQMMGLEETIQLYSHMEVIPLSTIVQQVWYNLQWQLKKPLDSEAKIDIKDALSSNNDNYGGEAEWHNWQNKLGGSNGLQTEYEKRLEARARREKLPVEAKTKKVKACKPFFAWFSFSDDTALGATMEHGEIFRNFPYVRFSHH